MPNSYLLVHLLLVGLLAGAAWRLPAGSRPYRVLAVVVLFGVMAGFALERRSYWAWLAMRLELPDLVFFTNLTLEGAAVLLVMLWRQASSRGARLRAAAFSPLLLGASAWSYAWYFSSPPANLHGTANPSGYCAQTSDYSCSAAAAVMLLHAHRIPATEAEMAGLCVTRAGSGTSPLGLYRGLFLKAREHGLKPVLVRARTAAGIKSLGGPAIVSVGLELNAPREVADKMSEYGWQPGQKHAVVFLDADPSGKWIDVADPSYGRERWPTADEAELAGIWDGLALVLRKW